MNFDKEDEITWDELSPSLQDKLKKLGFTEAEIRAFAKDETATYFNDNKSTIINLAMSSTPSGELKKYLDTMIFLNLSPKIGYYDDDCQAYITSMFNMGYNDSGSMRWRMSDFEGRENLYFFARKGSNGGTSEMYRQFRMKIGLTWSVQNEPVRPAFLMAGSQSDNLVTYCRGIGANYIFLDTSKGNHYLVKTNFSGNPLNWIQHTEISGLFAANLFPSIHSLSWVETDITNHTGLILVVYGKDNQIWFASCDESLNVKRNFILFDPNTPNSEYKNITSYNGGTNFCNNFTPWQNDWCEGGGIGWDYINNCVYVCVPIWEHWYTKMTDSSGNVKTVMTGRDAARYLFFGIYKNITADVLNGTSSSIDANVNGFYNFIAKSISFNPNTLQMRVNTPWGTNSFTYDTLSGVAWYSCTVYEESDAWGTYSFRKKWPMDTYESLPDNGKTSLDNFFQWSSDEVIQSPDTCPWAKCMHDFSIIDTGYGIGTYFHSQSQKYGWGWCAFTPVQVSGEEYGVKANSWMTPTSVPLDSVCCAKVNSVSRYFKISGDNIYEIKLKDRVDRNGITITDDLYLNTLGPHHLPEVRALLPDYWWVGIWAYNPNTGEEYFAFSRNDRNPGGTYDEDGLGVEVCYNPTTKQLIMYPGSHLNGGGIDGYGVYAHSECNENTTFIDCSSSSVTYVIFPWRFCNTASDGWGYNDLLLTITSPTTTVSSISSNVLRATGGYNYRSLTFSYWHDGRRYSIGYSQKYGYYVCWGDYSIAFLYYSKGNGNDYSFEDFYVNNKRNVIRFYTNTSTGLLAFVQAFPMFIGGYYSTIASSEIKLADNCYNYIYVVRDPDNHDQSYFESYTQKMNVEGASEFSRVYLGYIRTQNGNPVEQSLEYVNNDYKLGKLIASKV